MNRVDTSRHGRLRKEQMRDPDFRAEYLRARQAIAQIDSVMATLDQLRENAGCSKAELARQIGKQPAAVRRLFTAEVNPELRTVAEMCAALGAELRVVRRTRPRRVYAAAS